MTSSRTLVSTSVVNVVAPRQTQHVCAEAAVGSVTQACNES